MRDRRDAPPEQSQIAALRKFDQYFEMAMLAGNVNQLMDAFWNSPELIVYPHQGTVELRGYDAVKKYYERFLKARVIQFGHFEAHYQLLADSAVGWGKWRLVVQDKQKRQHVTEGRYTAIYAFIGDHWKYVIKHSSVPS